MSDLNNDPMLEAYIFETTQQIEQLEQAVINAETSGEYNTEIVAAIFRIMHTIKGSSAMMLFNNIAIVAHKTEDIFYFIRENSPKSVDVSELCDLVLEGTDFIKLELEKIKSGDKPDGDEETLLGRLKEFLVDLKKTNGYENDLTTKDSKASSNKFYISPSANKEYSYKYSYKIKLQFQKDCEMENIRAYMIIHNLQDITNELHFIPNDIIDNNESSELIKKEGFLIYFKSNNTYEEMNDFFSHVAFLEVYELTELKDSREFEKLVTENQTKQKLEKVNDKKVNTQHSKIISVNVQKLDALMDLVGELVISGAMVTQNPDLKGLNLENFFKAARHLEKISSEIQDVVMSIRMVPLGPTFFKMNRIVRDMCRSLNKDVHLDIIGEETEVDKNIIDNLGDPLMHLVRNCLDHGIETVEERIANGKSKEGTITLEAKNSGSEVLVIVKDNGKGLNKEKILNKAIKNKILTKSPEEMTDKEIYNLIFLPGFSTKENVTEYSGRGVGMDVVTKNLEAIGGSIQVESISGKGTTIILKIPLTLAIINGMNTRVGNSHYTLPITSIKESFRPTKEEVFKDPSGNEMILIRGGCYRILRLHEFYNVNTSVKRLDEGILIMIEHEQKAICLFVDELLGEQPVVVKSLPDFIKKIKKIRGLAGCTLLGDGSISLILDAEDLIKD
ncbi:MAG: chemotaxis protein CheA [Bacillales bacterium]|nr:chemotaxis protein CheA [Bacillales bacterium]